MADTSTCAPLTRSSVIEAHKLIAPHVHKTPIVTSRTLSAMASRPPTAEERKSLPQWEDVPDASSVTPASPRLRLWFKCENQQRVGAFKVRGAFHAVLRLMAEDGWLEAGGREKGVATHSSGNHAQALALAARENGLPAHIVMPTVSVPQKVAATRGYGARVVFSGSTSAEREAVAARVVEETGARLVAPYDHPDIILGQGTMGLEFQEQVREAKKAAEATQAQAQAQAQDDEARVSREARADGPGGLDAIMTPCGGGGMLSGVALSCEGTGIRVFGAEPSFEGADDARRGLLAGRRVEAVSSRTVADGLRTPLGRYNWGVIHDRGLVAGVYAASEAQIRAAMRLLLERCKLFVEPSAAVPLAVVLYNEDFRAMVEREAGPEGWDLGIVLSGGNVGVDALAALFADDGAASPCEN